MSDESNRLKELKELYGEFPELQVLEVQPETEKKDVDWSIISQKADIIMDIIKERRSKRTGTN